MAYGTGQVIDIEFVRVVAEDHAKYLKVNLRNALIAYPAGVNSRIQNGNRVKAYAACLS